MTRRAFTLVEILLALALVGLVAGITFAALRDLGERERQINDHAARVQQLATLDTLIERGLRGSVVQLGDAPGVTLAGGTLSLLHMGVAPTSESSIDRIDMSLTWDMASGSVLVSHAGDVPLSETVVEGVAWFDIRVHDGAAWRASFDSNRAGALPAAVRVSVWFGPAPLAGPDAGPIATEPAGLDDRAGAPGSPPAFDDLFAKDDPFSAEAAQTPSGGQPAPPTRAPDRTRVYSIPDGARASGEVAP